MAGNTETVVRARIIREACQEVGGAVGALQLVLYGRRAALREMVQPLNRAMVRCSLTDRCVGVAAEHLPTTVRTCGQWKRARPPRHRRDMRPPAQTTRRAPACTAAVGAIDGIRTRASGDTTRRSTTELRTPRWRRSDSNRQPSACEADALPDLSYIPSSSRQESDLRPLRCERSALPSELRDVGRSQGIELRPRPGGPFPLRYRLAGSRLAGQLSCCRSGTRTHHLIRVEDALFHLS